MVDLDGYQELTPMAIALRRSAADRKAILAALLSRTPLGG
jgi:hypothetical protein